ncbi:lipopolysaccharide biosynthesis protein [Kitasatospora sp. NBC_01539]|uniref:lipopolysaccharide biosynthesis protein n=1 Tax=Kitasatospora sp. NBC_01539 TaxID=2903577 RepID=UPI0038600CFD
MTGPVLRQAESVRPCSCPVPLPCECSYTSLVRARTRAAVRRAKHAEPLLRNAHLLAASSILAAGLGAVYWMFATRWYDAEAVGRSYAALSAVALLAAVGQLDLGAVLVRFVPAAGRHTRRLVLRCYAASTACSVLAAAGFLLLVPWLAPELRFLREPLLACAFGVATAGYALFVLQDAALTGLRRAGWVLGENVVFALVKAGALALCAAFAVGTGILVSWAAALLVAISVTTVVIFRWAVPAHERLDRHGAEMPTRIVRFAAADYVATLASLAPFTVVSLMILDRLGPELNAYYSLTWMVSYPCYLAATSMANSLIVEAVHAPERLAEHARRLMRHILLLMVGPVLLVTVAAPWILRIFGPGYAEHGTTVLRLMLITALPNVVLTIAVAAAKACRALRWMIGLEITFAALSITLAALLLPRLGLTGIGVAWLLAVCALALPLLLAMPRWLPVRPRRPA